MALTCSLPKELLQIIQTQLKNFKINSNLVSQLFTQPSGMFGRQKLKVLSYEN